MSGKNYVPRQAYRRGNTIYEHIYEIECYPESEDLQFDTILERIKTKFEYVKYVYAFHDKDVFEDGKPKKPHYHLILVFPREKSIKAVAHELEIKEHQIDWKQFLDKSVQYLIHLNHPNKYQYDVDIIHGTLDYEQYFITSKKSNLRNELSMIVDFVGEHKGHLTYYNLFTFCRDNDLLGTYKRWYPIIKDIFLE